MAVISFAENSPESAWVVAGWAFRQLLADVLMLHPDDAELARVLEEAETVGFLRLGCFANALAAKVTSAITGTADGILSGRIRSGITARFNDEQTTQEYRKGLSMLLKAAQIAEDRSACN
jgi:hypothetical protein